jgi:hypothetical protein
LIRGFWIRFWLSLFFAAMAFDTLEPLVPRLERQIIMMA